MDIILIAAVDKNWGIGCDNKLLYRNKKDQELFKDLTLYNTIVMGRKTLESLPNGNPLPDRTNVVLTSNKDYKKDGVIVIHNKDDLFKLNNYFYNDKVFIIGGESVYNEYLEYCNIAYITKTTRYFKYANKFLTDLDKKKRWDVEFSKVIDKDKYGNVISFNKYTRLY